MRELKFRVWLTEEKQMADVYGLYFYTRDKKPTLEAWYFIDFRLDMPKKGFEIMQYTGLKDRHGKEIYEGDIVSNVFGDKYVIKWISNLSAFKGVSTDKIFTIDLAYASDLLEVIGNIYENSEIGGIK